MSVLLYCAGAGEEEVSKDVDEAARTPSIVAEAMSKSLPESRATSIGSGHPASPAATDAVEDDLPAEKTDDGGTDAVEDDLPADETDDGGTDAVEEDLLADEADDGGTEEQVAVDDESTAEQPGDDVQDADDMAAGQDEVEQDDKEATAQVIRLIQVIWITRRAWQSQT